MNYLVKAVFSEKLKISIDELSFKLYFINPYYLKFVSDSQIDLHTKDTGIIFVPEITRKLIIK